MTCAKLWSDMMFLCNNDPNFYEIWFISSENLGEMVLRYCICIGPVFEGLKFSRENVVHFIAGYISYVMDQNKLQVVPKWAHYIYCGAKFEAHGTSSAFFSTQCPFVWSVYYCNAIWWSCWNYSLRGEQWQHVLHSWPVSWDFDRHEGVVSVFRFRFYHASLICIGEWGEWLCPRSLMTH